MRAQDTIDIKWDRLGAMLAAGTDEDQAAFLQGFGCEIDSWDSNYIKEVQAHAVAKGLTPPAKSGLKVFMPCLWYEERV